MLASQQPALQRPSPGGRPSGQHHSLLNVFAALARLPPACTGVQAQQSKVCATWHAQAVVLGEDEC